MNRRAFLAGAASLLGAIGLGRLLPAAPAPIPVSQATSTASATIDPLLWRGVVYDRGKVIWEGLLNVSPKTETFNDVELVWDEVERGPFIGGDRLVVSMGDVPMFETSIPQNVAITGVSMKLARA